MRLLVFVKPSAIAHIDLAAAHGAFPGVLGFAQWPPGDLLTDEGAARKWIFHARDFHLMLQTAGVFFPGGFDLGPFKNNQAPDCPEARPTRGEVHPPAAIVSTSSR
jgi:hypothetical protein